MGIIIVLFAKIGENNYYKRFVVVVICFYLIELYWFYF